jgi:hypothetical protein
MPNDPKLPKEGWIEGNKYFINIDNIDSAIDIGLTRKKAYREIISSYLNTTNFYDVTAAASSKGLLFLGEMVFMV